MAPSPPRWLELSSYALVALIAVLPTLLTPGHVVGDGVDLYGTFWFYWWIERCVAHLDNPGFTTLMFHPLGKDIFAHTGNNFVDALVAVPFQALLGFPRYQPWFVAFVLLGNALSFRPLARAVLKSPFAAWGATLLWQLCPFTLFEVMTGRLTQAFLWFFPLAVLFFLRIGGHPESPAAPRWRDAALAGLFTGLSGWTYWFEGYYLAGIFVVLGLGALWRSGDRRRLIAGYVLAGLCCLAVVGPAGLAMAGKAASGAVPGLAEDQPFQWSMLTQGPRALANNVATELHSYSLLEQWGQPMFAYAVWGGGALAFLLFGRDRRRWLLIALGGLAFAIGPVWEGSDGSHRVLPHYMAAYYLLPFFDRLWFPYRIILVTFLGVTLGIGTVMDRLLGWSATRRIAPKLATALPFCVALVPAVVTAVEQSPNLSYPLLHRDLTPPAIYGWLHQAEGGLIELPIGMNRASIAWQPVHGQPVWGGMGENAPVLWPDGMRARFKNNFIRFLQDVTRDPFGAQDRGFRPADLEKLRGEGFRWVVLDRSLAEALLSMRLPADRVAAGGAEDTTAAAVGVMMEWLGEPLLVEGPLVVWDVGAPGLPVPAVPEPLQASPERLRLHDWSRDDTPAYETRLTELGRMKAIGPQNRVGEPSEPRKKGPDTRPGPPPPSTEERPR